MAKLARWTAVLLGALVVYFFVVTPAILYMYRVAPPSHSETTSTPHLATTIVAPTLNAMLRPKVDVISEGIRLAIKAPDSACTCQGTDNSDKCDCVDCDPGEERVLCDQLLGNCECKRSEESMLCECSGYCMDTAARIKACRQEWGCSWNGVSCDVQEFDAYLVTHEDEDEEFVSNVETPDGDDVKLDVQTITV
eukprot:GEMP01049319.1.p1 GENE.GEMP01049319.1~~GEMP01049319.1.p1  ORF type:complete len:194 (+),score=50.47 GEMP01049319.1:300-881(+)